MSSREDLEEEPPETEKSTSKMLLLPNQSFQQPSTLNLTYQTKNQFWNKMLFQSTRRIVSYWAKCSAWAIRSLRVSQVTPNKRWRTTTPRPWMSSCSVFSKSSLTRWTLAEDRAAQWCPGAIFVEVRPIHGIVQQSQGQHAARGVHKGAPQRVWPAYRSHSPAGFSCP